jgi:signal transduction histidine kinase
VTRPRRTLQARLALLYTGVFFASGVVLLAIPDLALLGVNSTTRAGGGPAPSHALVGAPNGPDIHQLVAGSAIALVVLVPLSLVLGWLVAGRLLRPLRTITATARDISSGNLHRRLALGEPDDELKQLGSTLDDLFARLEASFESQRRFVANASHELRTPLAGQRTLIQVALADPGASAETLRSACEEVLTLSALQERLIDALLTLATSERGVERWETLDLAEVAGNVLASRRQEAAERGVEVEAALGPAPVAGDPRLLESLVANLVDNGLRHNRPGGRVEVRTAKVAGRASLSVRNAGPVVPEGEVQRLLQPFQRGRDRTRQAGGHGLGLAIVQAIARAHGAAVTAQARPEGGLDVSVRF